MAEDNAGGSWGPGGALFVRPPTVAGMRDPLNTGWNVAQSAADDRAADMAALIEFSLLNEIFENFLEVVGLPVAVIDLQGLVLASSRWQRLCIDYHRSCGSTLSRCLESDTRLSRDMAEGKAYSWYRCRNGLTDCATPIVVEGVHIANLFVGQFLLGPPDMEFFRCQQQEAGFEEQGYFQALSEIPIVAEDKLPAILRLMGGMARQIAGRSLAERRARQAYAAIEDQVQIRTCQLVESHERLRKIAARVPGMVYQFMRRADGGFCMPYASDAIRDLFGVGPEDVQDDATPVLAAVHPEDYGPLVASIEASAADLAPWRQEFRVLRPDGMVRWLAGDALPQREADGVVLWHGFISDTTERKRTEMLLTARLRLAGLTASQSLHDLLVAALDEACALTGSEVGYCHFLEADGCTLSLQAWSTRTTAEFCGASAEPGHYPVEQAGVWADCVRLRQSAVYNDYPSLPGRRGMPPGHAKVRRLMSVPIFRNARIVAILGVGNKATPYDEADVTVAEALADMVWDLAERTRAEEALAERSRLVQRRYEALRALNEIAALPATGGTARQVTEALELGAQYLGLPIGIVSRIEGERYTILHHCGPPTIPIDDGQVFPLGDTYCAVTLKAEGVLAIPHMGSSVHAGHPCYRTLGLESYIGTPVMVGGQRFGTVNFSSPEPCRRDFDEGDLEFMRLLARWVGAVMDREHAEAEVIAAKEAAEAQSRELASSNADLEQFAYVASHDLRQPLRMVNSYLGLIERRYGDLLDSEGHEFLAFARGGAQQMDRLILDLLEYSRVGRHGERLQVLDLAAVAAAAYCNLGPLADETGCRLEIATARAAVAGNRTELVRLFQNLIGNAIKYRAAGRPPRIEVGWRREADHWLVTVADNGIGIAPQFHQDVFKIFRRLHTAEAYEGTGIGLAICQKIVGNLGGRIWIESAEGKGSTFLFTLPAAVEEGAKVSPPAPDVAACAEGLG